MKSLFLSLLPFLLLAQSPDAYHDLGETLSHERAVFTSLASHPKLHNFKQALNVYVKEMDEGFTLGYTLDKEIQSDEGEGEEELRLLYLKALRSLEKKRKNLKNYYYQEVVDSMKNSDHAYFLFLVKNAGRLLDENGRLKARVLSYAREEKGFEEYGFVKKLQAEKELDERSYAFSQKMHNEYKAYQEVLQKAEALKLRQLLVSKKKGGVIVYVKEENADIHFVIENLYEMHVSATLFIENIQGYKTEALLPYKLVLQAKEKRKVLSLYNSDEKKRVGYFKPHIAWSKGSVDARADEGFIYVLPFHKSQKVSQGFNGNTSHKGSAKYAVDFSMEIGTEVYAARGGKVVEIVQHHNRHGMDKKMRQYANYIIIEHSDKTLGRYFHLKQNGVKVKLGDEVKTGDLLALSGDTGRTSGPHLHFVVTKAETFRNEYRSVSVPIRFQCSEGVVDTPVQGKSYCFVSKKDK